MDKENVFCFPFIQCNINEHMHVSLLVQSRSFEMIVNLSRSFISLPWDLSPHTMKSATPFSRATAFFLSQQAEWSGQKYYYPREMWPYFDPILLSEGMFGAANILR